VTEDEFNELRRKSEFTIDPSCGNISICWIDIDLVDTFLADLRNKIINGDIEKGIFSRKTHVTKMRHIPLGEKGMTYAYKHTVMIEYEDVMR